MQRIFYIYALIHPFTNEIRYIGQARDIQARYKSHIYTPTYDRSYRANWIRSLQSRLLQPDYFILEIGYGSDADTNKAEIWWIAFCRSRGARLTNMTDGGEGTSGYHHSAETRRRISESQRGKIISLESRQRMSEAQKGKTLSPETIEKLRILSTGRKMSPEAVEKTRQAHLGRKRSPEFREKMRRAKLGSKHSPEAIEKMRIARTGKKRSPLSREHIEKLRQSNIGRKQSQETIEKRRRKLIGRKRSPESRERIRLSMLGRTLSDEHKRKLSEALQGRKHSAEHIEKIRLTSLGRNHTQETKDRLSQLNSFAVRRLDTGEEFSSVPVAAAMIGVTSDAITHAIRHGTACYGTHWERCDITEEERTTRILQPGKLRPVRCIEDGAIFKSIADAARSVGADRTVLARAIQNNWRCRGYHWEYHTESATPDDEPSEFDEPQQMGFDL